METKTKITSAQEKRIRELFAMLEKGNGAVGAMGIHIFKMEDKFDDAMKLINESTPKIKDAADNVDKVRPVKGKDYFTPEEMNQIIDYLEKYVTSKIPPPLDEKKVTKKVADQVMKRVILPENGKDAEVDYDLIHSRLKEEFKQPKDGSPDTSDDILNKLHEGEGRLKLEKVEGSEKLVNESNLNRAIEILDKRTQFLINKNSSTVSTDSTLTGDGSSVSPLHVVGGGIAVYNEIVSGSGTTYTLANTPIAGTVRVFGAGQRLKLGAGNDYTISGSVITTANSFATGDILADYQK